MAADARRKHALFDRRRSASGVPGSRGLADSRGNTRRVLFAICKASHRSGRRESLCGGKDMTALVRFQRTLCWVTMIRVMSTVEQVERAIEALPLAERLQIYN